MKIGIATVGSQHIPICHGFRFYQVDLQILLHDEQTKNVALKAKELINDIACSDVCELIQINAFDFHDICNKIIGISKKYPDSQIWINFTGGTNIMASAAVHACFSIGAKAFYIRKIEGAQNIPLKDLIIDIPIPKASMDSLNSTQLKILKIINNDGGKLPSANLVLSKELDLKPNHVSYHMRGLKIKGLIEIREESDRRKKTVYLTSEGKFYAEQI